MSLPKMRYTKDEYCVKCGNSGKDINDQPCTCRFRVESFYDTVSCMEVPEQYRGLIFNSALLPRDLPESYGKYLTELHDGIISTRIKNKNVCLCSPVSHGKTVMAYSCIEQLFRKGIATFPVFDVLEVKRILLDLDLCRKPLYDVNNPEYLMTAPYVFLKFPRVPVWEAYDTAVSVLERRVRHGNMTVFLYDGTWEQLIRNDKLNVLAGLQGDGTYSTLEVSSWFSSAVATTHEVMLDENLG